MISSPLIKLTVLTVMSVHSLFGCGIHAVHEECCQKTVVECENSCSCDQEKKCQHGHKQENVSSCSSHPTAEIITLHERQNSEQKRDNLLCDLQSHSSPLTPPCQCACNGNNCVFVLDGTKPILVDRFFLEPATIELTSIDLLNQLFIHQLSPLERDSDTGKLQASCCAVTQVWMI